MRSDLRLALVAGSMGIGLVIFFFEKYLDNSDFFPNFATSNLNNKQIWKQM
jgi:hypothetical protein